MIHTFPLKLENMRFRSHDVIGIHELNGRIVYVQGALGDELQETPDKKTVYPNLVIADRFSPDFTVHSQTHVSYQKGVFYTTTSAESYVEDGRLFLNTYKTISKNTSPATYRNAFKTRCLKSPTWKSLRFRHFPNRKKKYFPTKKHTDLGIIFSAWFQR